MVHQNQYVSLFIIEAFNIVYPGSMNIYLCHMSKREMVLLRLDFEKAFDKIEHQAILNTS
jgi:hypothetical protein